MQGWGFQDGARSRELRGELDVAEVNVVEDGGVRGHVDVEALRGGRGGHSGRLDAVRGVDGEVEDVLTVGLSQEGWQVRCRQHGRFAHDVTSGRSQIVNSWN